MDEKEFCDALNEALDLEIKGHEFYMRCAEKTESKEGQDFFRFLAGEELIHHDKIAEIYKTEFNGSYCEYKKRAEAMREKENIFEEHVPGGDLSNISDALDALNIALRIEEKSIDLYAKLAREAKDESMEKFFSELAREEEKHHSLLETEIEFVTQTGAFRDFKVVTT